MEVQRQAFDRNLALFDVSSTLTFFRTKYSNSIRESFSEKTSKINELQRLFPRLVKTLEGHIKDGLEYELMFFPRVAGSEVCIEAGKSKRAEVFFISTKKQCPYQPGDIVVLKAGEELILAYADLSYGFIGISRPLLR